MLTEIRKNELLSVIRYNPSSKPNPIMVKVRSSSYLHSILNKSRIWYSKNILSKSLKDKYRDNMQHFEMSDVEANCVDELRVNGIAVLENYFDENFIDEIHKKVDTLFMNLKIDKNGGYNIGHGRLKTLEGMSYEEISIVEESVSMKDVLLSVPDTVGIAFNESFLKIVTNYFGFAPLHQVDVSRAFPHIPPVESSYFHKDSGNHEVLHIFVYLVDVDENGGPFCYIPRTHTNDAKSCAPMTNYDLGKNGAYGRISDEEIKKYYPESEWMPIKAKRGSVVIAHVNGLHKGPMWLGNDISKLNPRDIFQINFRSIKNKKSIKKSGKIYKNSIETFTTLQRLFLDNYKIFENDNRIHSVNE